MMSKRMVVGLALAVLVLAADQGSKYWVLHGLDLAARGDIPVLPPLLDFTMVWNNGVTFGLLRAWHRAGQLLLSGVAVAVVAGLLAWLRRAETMLVASSIGAIAGGALGNVADRFRLGVVVDFIHVHWGGWDPFPFVFNVGDSAIVIGVGLLLLESVLPARFRGRGSLQAPPPKA
jgi:lipoprotein signal peptidase